MKNLTHVSYLQYDALCMPWFLHSVVEKQIAENSGVAIGSFIVANCQCQRNADLPVFGVHLANT